MFNKNFSGKRLNLLKEAMQKSGFDCFVCIQNPNIQYLTANSKISNGGFVIFVPLNSQPTLLASRLEGERAKKEVKNVEVEVLGENEKFEDKISSKILEVKAEKVCFDSLTLPQLKTLRKKLSKVQFECKPEILLNLRKIKDFEEVKMLRKACRIADKAMKTAIEFLRAGVREYEVAAEAEYTMRRMGAEEVAFKTIVASGFRSSFPHAGNTNKKVRSGEAVVIDLGAKFLGYNSNLTRTVFVGKPANLQKKVYKTVLEAQTKALKNIRVGMVGWEADLLARKIVMEKGYGEYFIHGLGHGIGLEVHEPPTLSTKSKEKLEKMNVFTVEPGIYLPKKFGVRIEDTVLLTEDGLKPLTRYEKEFYQ
ncbi:MAG: aminopeptidase P family protein [Candidatus Hecatellales archaeon]|nr:MAG: aminopeptidase P family protein [Candidatus Hecatellales archaeon]